MQLPLIMFLLAFSIKGILLGKMLANICGCTVQKVLGDCFTDSVLQDFATYSLKHLIIKG